MFLAKYWREGFIKKNFIVNDFLRTKEKLWSDINEEHFIEVNPFNWAYGKFLCDELNNPAILHIVRDIPTWIISALNDHGLTKKYKFAKYFLPLWEINTKQYIEDWNSLSINEKIIQQWVWRWIIKNKTIDENEKYTNNFLRVKFEDIISKNPIIQEKTLERISIFYNINIDIEKSKTILKNKYNKSKKKKYSSFSSLDNKIQEDVLTLTSSLRKKYGYI